MRSELKALLTVCNYSIVQSPNKGYTPPDFLTYVLVGTAQTIKSMKTNNIPLKSPIKLQQEMKKKI